MVLKESEIFSLLCSGCVATSGLTGFVLANGSMSSRIRESKQ